MKKAERLALKYIREDDWIVVLQEDKGNARMIMSSSDYKKKVEGIYTTCKDQMNSTNREIQTRADWALKVPQKDEFRLN